MKSGYSCYYMLANGELPSKWFCEKRVECKYCEFYPPRNKAQGRKSLIPVECRECISFHAEGRISVPCRGDFDPHNCENAAINEPLYVFHSLQEYLDILPEPATFREKLLRWWSNLIDTVLILAFKLRKIGGRK